MHPVQPGAPLVLIAERDRIVRDLQSHALEKAGFRVEFVDDGQEVLDRVRIARPVLVVTEILLPRVDGLTLCRLLNEDPETRDVPVLVFSILSAQARASEAGATAYLRKPFVGSLFIATVNQALATPSEALTETQ